MRRALLTLALLLAATALLVPAASGASTAALGDGQSCDENTNPRAVVLCDGSGDMALRLNGSALYLGLDEGTVAIRVDSRPARRARLRVPCLDDPEAEILSFRDGDYKVCEGPFYAQLRKGTWNLRLTGSGINAALFGRGQIWLRGDAGLISIFGAPYQPWPSELRVYRFPRPVNSAPLQPTLKP